MIGPHASQARPAPRRRTPAGAAAATALACLLAGAAGVHATPLDTELLVNGGAETGDLTGWLADGIEPVSTAVSGVTGLPAGVDVGLWSFHGGPGPAGGQTLAQAVDVADLASTIDSGGLQVDFSILVQSRRNADTTDIATGTLSFFGAGGDVLGSFAFADGSILMDSADWSQASYSGVLPTGTRSMTVSLLATRLGGTSTDAYFDNASLLVSAVPEAPTAALLLAGLVAIGSKRARRRG